MTHASELGMDAFPVLQISASESELRDQGLRFESGTDEDLGAFRISRFRSGPISGFFQRYESNALDEFTLFLDMPGCVTIGYSPLMMGKALIQTFKLEERVSWFNEEVEEVYEQWLMRKELPEDRLSGRELEVFSALRAGRNPLDNIVGASSSRVLEAHLNLLKSVQRQLLDTSALLRAVEARADVSRDSVRK